MSFEIYIKHEDGSEEHIHPFEYDDTGELVDDSLIRASLWLRDGEVSEDLLGHASAGGELYIDLNGDVPNIGLTLPDGEEVSHEDWQAGEHPADEE